MHSQGGVGETCFIFVIVTESYYRILVTPKLAKGVGMDGERIIKLSGQGSVCVHQIPGALWSNLVEIMKEIAHKVQKPQCVSDCWQLILVHLKIYFSDVKSLHQLYSSIKPMFKLLPT